MVIIPRTVGALRIAPLASGVADHIRGPTKDLEHVFNTGPPGTNKVQQHTKYEAGP